MKIPFRSLLSRLRLGARVARRRAADALSLRTFRMVRAGDRAGDRGGFPVLLSEYSAPVVNPPGQAAFYENKLHNLRIACGMFDGLVVGPGRLVSFYGVIGYPDESRGYREAAALAGGEIVASMGGSLCQLSGVLYNAALLSGMQIVERHPHSVDAYGEGRYIPLGRDATATWGYKDLRFVNPGPRPVLLAARLAEGKVTVAVHGMAGEAPPRISIEVNLLGEEKAGTVETADPSLAPGARVEEFGGYDGKKTATYRITTLPDNSVKRELLSRDNYASLARRVKVGK